MGKNQYAPLSPPYLLYLNDPGRLYDFDKTAITRDITQKMLRDVKSMVHYTGLPETVPETDFKRIIQMSGYVSLPRPEVIGKVYALWGSLGGEYTEYYLPSMATVANPYIKTKSGASYSGTLHEGKNCTIIPHDSQFMGLMPIIRRYATLLAETEISLRMAIICARSPYVFTAMSDDQKLSIDEFMKNLIDGKLSSIVGNNFSGPPEALPFSGSNQGEGGSIKALLEAYQYLESKFWINLGVSAQWNTKRESLNETETASGDDILTPTLDDIIDTQNAAFERYEALTGIHIRVELSGVWKRIKDDSEITAEEMKEADPKEPEGGEDDEQKKAE